MISSTGNATVKRIRALRQRRERERSGSFFAEGIRIVAEAVQMGADIETLVVAPALLRSDFALEVVRGAAEQGVPVLEVTAPVFQTLSGKEGPQGLGAVIRQRWTPLEQVQLGDPLCWTGLEAVADPGNLGTILRTSDAVGGGGVVLMGDCTDPYDPAALRASMGAVFTQSLVRADLQAFAAWARECHVTVVGTSDAGDVSYRDAAYRQPLVLLMGNERQGLSAEALALCDVVVRIPMLGRGDSLNLAVATGVMLYQILAAVHSEQ
jgi:TrmH family RNA methyltransferase